MSPWLLPAAVAVALLACFLLRRAAFIAAALAPPRPFGDPIAEPPSVTLLVPARLEGSALDAGLEALSRLEYPRERLFVVLVADGSGDSTADRFRGWAAGRPRVLVLDLPDRVGKFEALNRGIGAAPASELIAVCDADIHPRPTWLRELVAPFGDPSVGAVAGCLSPVNATRGPVARYAACESWVHQLVTSAAKDRLDLDPPTLGACGYRWIALQRAGWFRGLGPGEDVQISAELTRAGWRARFAPAAIADNRVVEGWADYWHQHLRWARNVLSTARARPRSASPGPIGPLRRMEGWMAAAGYVDRLALLAVVAFTLTGLLPAWPAAAYLAVVVIELTIAVAKAGAGRRLPGFLTSAALLFVLDLVASAAAVGAHLLGRPRRWRPSRRDARVSDDSAV